MLVYHMDKQKRDVAKLTDILDANGVTVHGRRTSRRTRRRSSRCGATARAHRLPVVFIAGECLGGRERAVNAARRAS